MKRTLAFLLAFVMLFALAVPMVSAENSEQSAPISYEQARSFQLLYTVDFNSNVYAPTALNNTTGKATPTDNGATLTLLDSSSDSAFYSVGGELQGLSYDGDNVYIVEFDAFSNSTIFVGFGAPAGTTDKVSKFGFAIKSGNANAIKRETKDFANSSSGWVYPSRLDVNGKNRFRFIVNEAEQTITMYLLNSENVWQDLGITGTGFIPNTDDLYFCFGTYDTKEAYLSNFKIYKGDTSKNGELLYSVDFEEGVYDYAPINDNGVEVTASENILTLQSPKSGYYSVGGEMAAVPYTGSSVYTIDFKITNPSTAFIAFAPPAEGDTTAIKGTYGYAIAGNRAARDTTEFSNGKSGWSYYSTIEGGGQLVEDGFTSFRFVVDEAAGTIKLYFLKESTNKYVLISDVTGEGFEPTTENLYLSLGNYSTEEAKFADIKIYKGDLGTDSVYRDELGALVYDANFNDKTRFDYAAQGSVTGSIIPSEDGKSLTINGDSNKFNVGGEIKGLPLDENSNYTVEFSLTMYGTYHSHFVSLAPGSDGLGSYTVLLRTEFLQVENSVSDVDFTAPSSSTKYYLAYPPAGTTRTVRAVIDRNAETVDYYYLNEGGTWIYAMTAEGYAPSTENLHFYFCVYNIGQDAVLSDLKVYSNSKIVEVKDGDSTEYVSIDESAESYMLPKATKDGYMFKGWKVNGSDEILNSGEAVATAGLTRLEKVFVPVMSEIWVQTSVSEKDATKRNVRFVSGIDSLKYSAIGYDVTISYQDKSFDNNGFELKHVYTSLYASYGAEEITLETLEYDNNDGYITAFVIKNVPTTVGDITVELTPYQVSPDGNTVKGEKVALLLTVEDLTK